MSKLRLAITAAVAAIILSLPFVAFGSQNNLYNPTTGTLAGLSMVQGFNNALDSVNTCNSGGSAPSNQLSGVPSLGNCWINTSTSPNTMNRYDGTDWIPIGYFDTTNHLWIPIVGGGVTVGLASASTTNLCPATPNNSENAYLVISGTATINSFGTNCQQGQIKFLLFTGAATLVNSASIQLPTGANITTANGDAAIFVWEASSSIWICLSYTPASGLSLGPIASHTVMANTGGSSAPAAADSLTSIIDAMIGSTQGDILYRGASNWSVLGPGTAGQLLQTGGASANPSWATVAAPVLLNTVSGSGVASLSDTTSITSTYPTYRIVMQNLACATASEIMQIQIHSNSAFQTSSYVSTAAGAISQTDTSGVPMSAAETMSASGLSGEFEITAPSQTSSPKQLFGKDSYSTSAPAGRAVVFGGNWTGGNTAVDGFQIDCQSGNITGTLRVYGLP